VPTLRIATFNLENLDDTAAGEEPSLADRIALMRPQITRLRADIACFQEVNGQERPGQPRALLALGELLAGTNLDGAQMVSIKPEDDAVYNERNLVVVTHLPVPAHRQLRNDLVAKPRYTRLTAAPPTPARSRSPSSGRSCTPGSTSPRTAAGCCTSSTCT